MVTLQREEAAAKACYAAFEQAMERRDYAAAIARFEEYRTLPDKQDAAETVAMERKLDSACRRVGLHHLAPPAVDTAGFDMTPLAQEWVCILNGNTYRLHEKGTGSIKNTPYEAPVTRAQELVKKKLPLAYRDDAGEKRTLEGDMVFTRMLSRDMKTAYVSVEKRGPGAKLGAVEVDLTTGKMKVAALNAHSLLPAPNGTTMVEWRHDGVMVFNGSLTGRLVPVDTRGKGSIDDMTILSDSRFALYHAANPHRYGIIPLFPENAAATDMSLPPEPELPAGSSSEGIRLTADGCHILRRLREEHKVQENGLTILKDRTQRDVPWLRLSWSFAPPEKTEIDRKTPASPAADAAQPPKGFLSRLFGKRG